MIKYKQIKSDPKNNIWGDCTRCCIAGLLDVPKDRVDDFSLREDDEDGSRM